MCIKKGRNIQARDQHQETYQYFEAGSYYISWTGLKLLLSAPPAIVLGLPVEIINKTYYFWGKNTTFCSKTLVKISIWRKRYLSFPKTQILFFSYPVFLWRGRQTFASFSPPLPLPFPYSLPPIKLPMQKTQILPIMNLYFNNSILANYNFKYWNHRFASRIFDTI